MYLIEQKSCNLLPQIEKKPTKPKQNKNKKNKNVNKCGRWKVQNRTACCRTLQVKIKEKKFKKLKVEEIKCRDTSALSHISNCDGVVLEIYFGHKLQ